MAEPAVPDTQVEEWLVKALAPEEAFSLDGARYAAIIAVLCAYDRKVEREFFADVLATTLNITHAATELEYAASVVGALIKAEPERGTPEVLDAAIKDRVKDLHRFRAKLHKKMALVAEMPPPGTKLS